MEHEGVSFARYSPGFDAAGHTHNQQEEVYVLVSAGRRSLVGDNEVVERSVDGASRAPGDAAGLARGGQRGRDLRQGRRSAYGAGDARGVPDSFAWPAKR